MSGTKRKRDEEEDETQKRGPPYLLGGLALSAAFMRVNGPNVHYMLQFSLSTTPLVKPQLSPATLHSLKGCGAIVSLLRERLGLSSTMPFARRQKSLEVRCMNACITKIRTTSAVIADIQRQAGQCADALKSYENALSFGHLPSTARIANYKVDGRLGVPADPETAFALARMGKLNGDAGCTAIDSWIDMSKSRYDESAYCRANDNLNALPSTCFADFARAHWMGTRQLSYHEAKFDSVEIKWNTLQMLIKAACSGLDRAMFEAGIQLVCNQVAFKAGLQEDWEQPLNDFPQAYLLFVGSANQGFPPAMRSLGDCFRNGWGVDKDLNEARKWYEQASDAGCDCTVELAELDKLPSVEMAEEMP